MSACISGQAAVLLTQKFKMTTTLSDSLHAGNLKLNTLLIKLSSLPCLSLSYHRKEKIFVK